MANKKYLDIYLSGQMSKPLRLESGKTYRLIMKGDYKQVLLPCAPNRMRVYNSKKTGWVAYLYEPNKHNYSACVPFGVLYLEDKDTPLKDALIFRGEV